MWITLKLEKNDTSHELFEQLHSHAGVYAVREKEHGKLFIGDKLNVETNFSEEGAVTLTVLIKPQIDG